MFDIPCPGYSKSPVQCTPTPLSRVPLPNKPCSTSTQLTLSTPHNLTLPPTVLDPITPHPTSLFKDRHDCSYRAFTGNCTRTRSRPSTAGRLPTLPPSRTCMIPDHVEVSPLLLFSLYIHPTHITPLPLTSQVTHFPITPLPLTSQVTHTSITPLHLTRLAHPNPITPLPLTGQVHSTPATHLPPPATYNPLPLPLYPLPAGCTPLPLPLYPSTPHQPNKTHSHYPSTT